MAELDKDEVELFDDYLEMVMTFGYITLFAAAFPFGSTLTCLFIYLETKSDVFKLETVARRPFVRKCHDIGTWEFALDLLAFMSIFTNIVLACYASDQIDYVLPWLKELRESSATSIVTIFGIEHFMITIVLLIRFYLDSDPSWIKTFRARQQHKMLKRHKNTALQSRKTLKMK